MNDNKKVGNGNLIVPTSEQARENGRKGGKASAEARRKRKEMAQAFDVLLSLPLKDEKANAYLDYLGIPEDDRNNQMGLVISMYKEAVTKGNVPAANFIRDTVGEKPVEKINNNINGNINNPFEGLSTEELKELIKDE